MSNAIDDKELDDYLSGGTQYSRRYRAIASDAVPPELDSLVLSNTKESNVVAIDVAADKRAGIAQRSKSLGFWMRVSVPVTLAASFVLVLSIMMESGVRYDSAPVAQMDAPEAQQQIPFPKVDINQGQAEYEQPVASPAPSILALEKRQEAPERRFQDATSSAIDPLSEKSRAATAAPVPVVAAEAKKETYPPLAPTAPAAAPTSDTRSARNTAATTELDHVIVTGTFVRGTAEDAALPVDVITSESLDKVGSTTAAGPRSTIPQSSFQKRALSDAELTQQQREANADEWLKYIRELRANGKAREADAEWRRFEKAYPAFAVDAADAARPKR